MAVPADGQRSSMESFVLRFTSALCVAMAILASTVVAESPSGNHLPLSTIGDVDRELRSFITDQFPDAKFTVTDDNFVVKVNTMNYMVHPTFRGRFWERAIPTEGPRPDGFLLWIERKNGRYGGPAFVPQTYRKPYWNSTINEIVDAQAKTHLWVVYEWGRYIDKDFHKDLRTRLRCVPAWPEDIKEIITDEDQPNSH